MSLSVTPNPCHQSQQGPRSWVPYGVGREAGQPSTLTWFRWTSFSQQEGGGG